MAMINTILLFHCDLFELLIISHISDYNIFLSSILINDLFSKEVNGDGLI